MLSRTLLSPWIQLANALSVGNYAGGYGATVPSLCFPGSWAPLDNNSVQSMPAGYSCTTYGTYVPSICPRVPTDPCRFHHMPLCPQGTWGLETGQPDQSNCYPCPQGRICGSEGIKRMESLRHAQMVMSAGALRRRLLNLIIHARLAIGATRAQSVSAMRWTLHCWRILSTGNKRILGCLFQVPTGFYCPKGTASQLQMSSDVHHDAHTDGIWESHPMSSSGDQCL